MTTLAKTATTDPDLVERFLRRVDKNAYTIRQIAGDRNLKAILALSDQSLCTIAVNLVERITDIRVKENHWYKTRTSKSGTSPWQGSHGLPISLLLQRVLLKKLPFSAPQLRALGESLCKEASSFTTAAVASAFIRGVEAGTLADPKLAHNVERALREHSDRDVAKQSTKLALVLKNAAQSGGTYPSSPCSTSSVTTTSVDVQPFIKKFVRGVSKDIWRASELAKDRNAQAILNLDGATLCSTAMILTDRLIALEQRIAKQGPKSDLWTSERGRPQRLLLERILLKKIPLSAAQLEVLANSLLKESDALIMSSSAIASALLRGVESGVLHGKGLQQASAVARMLEKVRDKTGVRLAAAIKAAPSKAPETTSSKPRPVPPSPLESLLLSRESLKPSTTPSLTDRLFTALTIPPETEPKGIASFNDKPFGKHADIIRAINKILAAQPVRYQDDPISKIRAEVTKIAAAGVPGVALTAAALSAMSLKPIKHNFNDERSERYHNGRVALLNAIPATLESAKKSTPDSLSDLCHALSRFRTVEYYNLDWPIIAAAIATHATKLDLKKSDQSLLINLLRFRERLLRAESPRDRAATQSLDEALQIGPNLPTDLGEPWSDRLATDLRAMKDVSRTAWLRVLETCLLATSAQPTTKWLKQLDDALAPIKRDDILKRLESWLPLAGKNRPSMPGGKIEGRDSSVPSERAADLLRGLAFIAARFDTPRSAKALGDLAMAGYKMVPGIGARCPKPATASVWALSQLKNPEALSQLSRIRQLVKFGTAKKVLDSALNKLAKQLNVSTDELHEMAAPDFGLERDGTLREEAGDYTLELRIEDGSADVRILDDDNKEPKTTPDALKKDATLKQLKLLAADIDKMLPAQKDRLERLYHEQRVWPAATWRTRYIDHALVGTLGRRLIWNFTRGKSTTSAIWNGDGFVTSSAKGIEVADDDTVSLWHPPSPRPRMSPPGAPIWNRANSNSPSSRPTVRFTSSPMPRDAHAPTPTATPRTSSSRASSTPSARTAAGNTRSSSWTPASHRCSRFPSGTSTPASLSTLSAMTRSAPPAPSPTFRPTRSPSAARPAARTSPSPRFRPSLSPKSCAISIFSSACVASATTPNGRMAVPKAPTASTGGTTASASSPAAVTPARSSSPASSRSSKSPPRPPSTAAS